MSHVLFPLASGMIHSTVYLKKSKFLSSTYFNLQEDKIEKAQWFGKQEVWTLQSALNIHLSLLLPIKWRDLNRSQSFLQLSLFEHFPYIHYLQNLSFIQLMVYKALLSLSSWKLCEVSICFTNEGSEVQKVRDILKIVTGRARSWT